MEGKNGKRWKGCDERKKKQKRKQRDEQMKDYVNERIEGKNGKIRKEKIKEDSKEVFGQTL